MFKVPNQYRLTTVMLDKVMRVWNPRRNLSGMVTNELAGNNGFFILPNPRTGNGLYLLCLASDGMGWDHVSVSIPTEQRCPTWEEMCYVKKLFWDEEDTVIEYHPPRSEYVNNHEFCLHLWRKQNFEQPLPPKALVGI